MSTPAYCMVMLMMCICITEPPCSQSLYLLGFTPDYQGGQGVVSASDINVSLLENGRLSTDCQNSPRRSINPTRHWQLSIRSWSVFTVSRPSYYQTAFVSKTQRKSSCYQSQQKLARNGEKSGEQRSVPLCALS